MMNLSRWKIGVVLAAAIFGILFSLPNFLPADIRAQIPGFLPSKTLNLGLDLQGGSYLLLEVDSDAMVKERVTGLVEDVREQLTAQHIAFTGLATQGRSVTVSITDPTRVDDAFSIVSKMSTPLIKSPGQHDLNVGKSGQTITATLSQQGIDEATSGAVDVSLGIIAKRINPGGNKEQTIVRQGSDRIVVEAPGDNNPEELKRLIGQTAKMTFQMVDETVGPADIAANRLPPGTELLPNDDANGQLLAVRKKILVDGKDLKKASTSQDQSGRPAIGFAFDGIGAQAFGEATAKNVGKRFAIILDGHIISAPVIDSPIIGGTGIIQGNFSYESMTELVNELNGGALPAPLKFEEQRSVGPELGADSVLKGEQATGIAFICVLVFVLLAYGLLFGGISVLSLFLNLFLLVGIMSMMQSTLTLPGIAGLILTLAMAVDANVLIYERIRDELRNGRPLIVALNNGFSRALETILDANITTLVAALIMYWFGAGTVKGFAITLGIGTLTSVFSSVMVSMVLTGWWYKAGRPKTMPIAEGVSPKAWPLIKVLPKKTDIHFVNYARLFAALSAVAVIGSLVMSVGLPPKLPCGGLTCGIDFTGGTVLEMKSPTPMDLGQLRADLNSQGLKDVEVQGVGGGTAQSTIDAILRFETPQGDPVARVEVVKTELRTHFAAATFGSTEVVGAKVSGELLTGGILALFIAIGLMMLYIWFRFGWQFGLGAVVALFHDVILTFGIFAVFHLEFDLRAVAAILTIIGYSMNDTVVVIDRLRENLRKFKKMPLAEVINLSINETLSRTVITGLTAVLALAGLTFLGGETLFSFSAAMMFGIIIGTYSSIYVASPIILLWGVNRNAGDAEIIDMGGFKGAKKPRQMP
jgi:SecD/SecF fusion protein